MAACRPVPRVVVVGGVGTSRRESTCRIGAVRGRLERKKAVS